MYLVLLEVVTIPDPYPPLIVLAAILLVVEDYRQGLKFYDAMFEQRPSRLRRLWWAFLALIRR